MSTELKPLTYGPAGAGAPQDPLTLIVGQMYLVEGLYGYCSFRGIFTGYQDQNLLFMCGPIECKVPQLAANFWKSG